MSQIDPLPGAVPYAPALQEQVQAALKAKGSDYKPRTEHLLPNGQPQFTNRLILEDSPYLLQHAHNPVNWYPWGPEAFDVARREDKPIFLSIGYATCHWCHVMERESFENIEIARILNEGYIAIKVDREQRPDVDEIYMTAVVQTTGMGGWPMSSFLTPDGKPFLSATYIPPDNFRNQLLRINQIWHSQRQQIENRSNQVSEAVAKSMAVKNSARAVDKKAIQKTMETILSYHDARHGGFGGAPKFPHEPALFLLLQNALRNGNKKALDAIDKSLKAMAQGGIFDQVGGGFHRYSTDVNWLVPHFEKMLYNQAQLGRVYAHAYHLTGDWFYARVARQTFDYVLRDLHFPQGGFYSATDADSEGEEGLFFVWTPDEIKTALSAEQADLALNLFGISKSGNFEGRNILHLSMPLEEYASKHALSLEVLLQQVNHIREQLYQTREQRVHPLRDDKILTAWNGMMITALAEASEILREPRYEHAAIRAAEFLWANNRKPSGDLWRVHLNGRSSISAGQEDYAYLVEAFVTLYDMTENAVWLDRASEIADEMIAQFWDDQQGGFFMSAEGVDNHLIARPKNSTDGATASGNSVAIRALTMLANRTGDETYRTRTETAISAFGTALLQYPSSYAYLIAAVDEWLQGAAGSRQYGAQGHVKATALFVPQKPGIGQVTIQLAIQNSWHINAHKPLQQDLIATQISIDASRKSWQLNSVIYPEPKQVKLSFQQTPLSVYEGKNEITAELSCDSGTLDRATVISIRLQFQACNDQICLLPEEMVLNVPIGVLEK